MVKALFMSHWVFMTIFLMETSVRNGTEKNVIGFLINVQDGLATDSSKSSVG